MQDFIGNSRDELNEALEFIKLALEGMQGLDPSLKDKKEIEVAALALRIAKKKISTLLDQPAD